MLLVTFLCYVDFFGSFLFELVFIETHGNFIMPITKNPDIFKHDSFKGYTWILSWIFMGLSKLNNGKL